jgi:hypothetical protein
MWLRRTGNWLALVASLVVVSQRPASSQCLDWKPSFGPLGGGTSGDVRAFVVFDDGAGPALYAAGTFSTAGNTVASGVARWNGSSWSALGQQSFVGQNSYFPTIYALAVFDDGGGPALYAAGAFFVAGAPTAANIAKWNGTSWVALGAGLGQGDFVRALTVFDDGSGPALYAGGTFTNSGTTYTPYLARWNGSAWSAVPGYNLVNNVRALTVFDDGHGPRLYVGGDFYVLKWTLSGWVTIGGDGVSARAGFDDGTGPALYAGGTFTSLGGSATSHVAKWNGSTWSPLGAGTDGSVESLLSFDDGSGAALYAGGTFTSAGGASANHVAKWNGAAWSSLANGVTSATIT